MKYANEVEFMNNFGSKKEFIYGWLIKKELFDKKNVVTEIINGVEYVYIYIGQTNDVIKRYREHVIENTILLDRKIKEIGIENFKAVLLDNADTKEEIDKLEKEWIDILNTQAPNGSNVAYGMWVEPKKKFVNIKAYTYKGEFAGEYKDVNEASRKLKIHTGYIRNILNGKAKYTWSREINEKVTFACVHLTWYVILSFTNVKPTQGYLLGGLFICLQAADSLYVHFLTRVDIYCLTNVLRGATMPEGKDYQERFRGKEKIYIGKFWGEKKFCLTMNRIRGSKRDIPPTLSFPFPYSTNVMVVVY